MQYNTIEKKLGSGVCTVGLHGGAPFFRFIKFPSVYKTLKYENEDSVSKYGIKVDLTLDMQYLMGQGRVLKLLSCYSNDENHRGVLYWAIQSAVHNSFSRFLIMEF